jgi:hypothetical protein
MVPVAPAQRPERRGEIAHVGGLRDQSGRALAASEPIPLPPGMLLHVGCRHFPLRQLVWRG